MGTYCYNLPLGDFLNLPAISESDGVIGRGADTPLL
jgi:hypothetical protein